MVCRFGAISSLDLTKQALHVECRFQVFAEEDAPAAAPAATLPTAPTTAPAADPVPEAEIYKITGDYKAGNCYSVNRDMHIHVHINENLCIHVHDGKLEYGVFLHAHTYIRITSANSTGSISSEDGWSTAHAASSELIIFPSPSLCHVADFCALHFPDVSSLLAKMKAATMVKRGEPDIKVTVESARDEMNRFTAYYRRNNKVAGAASFSTLYTAISTLSGHFQNYGPEYPVPAKRQKVMRYILCMHVHICVPPPSLVSSRRTGSYEESGENKKPVCCILQNFLFSCFLPILQNFLHFSISRF